jgi:hypothetical protein
MISRELFIVVIVGLTAVALILVALAVNDRRP